MGIPFFRENIKLEILETNSIGVIAIYHTKEGSSLKELHEKSEKIYKAGDDVWRYLGSGNVVVNTEWCDARLFEHNFNNTRPEESE